METPKPEVLPVHQRRRILRSDDMRFTELAGNGWLTHQESGLRVSCPVIFSWTHPKRVYIAFKGDAITLASFAPIGTPVRFEAELTSCDWAGWRLHCEAAQVCYYGYRQTRSSNPVAEIKLSPSPPAPVILSAPNFDRIARESDVMVYWLQNFFFTPLECDSEADARQALDRFVVNLPGVDLAFCLAADHDDLKMRCRDDELMSALASVMELRGQLCAGGLESEKKLDSLFSMMSGINGSWVWPAAVGRYGYNDQLKEIIFKNDRARRFSASRPAIDNDNIKDGWPSLISGMWPGFAKHAEALNLGSACRQLVEAQDRLMSHSAIAILLMCLEQMTTFYVKTKQAITQDTSLKNKIKICQRDLRCLSKSFCKDIDNAIRITLRNPLIHTGHIEEMDVMTLWQWNLDLQNAAILILCAMSGYRGSIKLHTVRNSRVTTIDEEGRS